MIQGDEHIHRTGLDGDADAHTLESTIGLNDFLNLALDGSISLNNYGNNPNFTFNFNDPFGFPSNLFVKHFLNIAVNRTIQHNKSILHGDFDFTGS